MRSRECPWQAERPVEIRIERRECVLQMIFRLIEREGRSPMTHELAESLGGHVKMLDCRLSTTAKEGLCLGRKGRIYGTRELRLDREIPDGDCSRDLRDVVIAVDG